MLTNRFEIDEIKLKIASLGQDADKFCLVPFTTVILEPDGSVGVCRQKGTKFSIGNIKENTLSEIWNGEKVRAWRKEFLEGSISICTKEMKHQHCHHCPENNKLLDDIELTEFQTKPILKLTANFNGKCNLQCQMCDIWAMPNGLYDEMNFWTPAKAEIFPHLREIDMLSGEPFIQKDTFRLIDEVHSVNPNCEWMFTTNMHWKLNKQIESYLDKIKIKYIIMSVDSFIAESYFKIRYPGKLDFVLDNIENMLTYNNERLKRGLPKIKFHLNFLAQQDNWQEVSYAINFCESRGIIPFVSFLYQPHALSLLNLDYQKRLEITEFYLNELSPTELLKNMRVMTPLMDSLKNIDKASYLISLKEKTQGKPL